MCNAWFVSGAEPWCRWYIIPLILFSEYWTSVFRVAGDSVFAVVSRCPSSRHPLQVVALVLWPRWAYIAHCQKHHRTTRCSAPWCFWRFPDIFRRSTLYDGCPFPWWGSSNHLSLGPCFGDPTFWGARQSSSRASWCPLSWRWVWPVRLLTGMGSGWYTVQAPGTKGLLKVKKKNSSIDEISLRYQCFCSFTIVAYFNIYSSSYVFHCFPENSIVHFRIRFWQLCDV